MTPWNLALWAPIVGTWVLVVGTLVFAYWQLRQAQRLHSATTILELRERFYSPRLRRARLELSRWLLAAPRGPEIDNWEVTHFFELMGFLTRTGVLEKRMVWNAFGGWITAYYEFATRPDDLIGRWRRDSHDPLIYAEFEWLARQMLELDRRLLHVRKGADDPFSEARIALEAEATLDPSDGAQLGPVPPPG